MLRRFTRKVKKLRLIEEIKERRFYEKPGDARRKKQAMAKRAKERLERKAKARKRTNYRRKASNKNKESKKT